MFDLLVPMCTSLPPKLQGAFTEAIRSLTSCRDEVNHYMLCAPHLRCSFYLWGELFRGKDRMEGRAGSDTYLRVVVSLSFCLPNQQLRDRPDTVNIKFSFAGRKPVSPEWPDKGSCHFLSDKISLS